MVGCVIECLGLMVSVVVICVCVVDLGLFVYEGY